ncbi:YfbM family protein [Ideonella sp. DXS29W]|uniref:YfbM family protein n=1 Tax=Ideonella lacteola TaxID=2984193 RepID=A0ABU9BYK8_9BURK
MAVCFAAVSPATLARLQRAPEEVERYLVPDNGMAEPPHSTDVDKAWHGIHYLLTGTAWEGREPFCWAVMAQPKIGPDLGMGPARYLTAEQVVRLTAALDSLTVDDLSARYDPQAMEALRIYPDAIWRRDGEEALQYLLDHFTHLLDFYRDAAARGDAVLQWVC